jgi:hypothetical protein
LLPVNPPNEANHEDRTLVMFAHQGGWDEMLFVIVPIAAIFGLLRLAQKRAKRRGPQSSDPNRSQSTVTGSPSE